MLQTQQRGACLPSLLQTVLVLTNEYVNAAVVRVGILLAWVVELQHEAQWLLAVGTRQIAAFGNGVGNQPKGLASELGAIPDAPALFARHQKSKLRARHVAGNAQKGKRMENNAPFAQKSGNGGSLFLAHIIIS